MQSENTPSEKPADPSAGSEQAEAHQIDRSQLRRELDFNSRLTQEFLVLLLSAALIATLGLFANSAATIIGAMIVAPLMRPLSALWLALITADSRMLRQAVLTLIVGTALVLAISFGLAKILESIEITAEILARTQPNLLDLGVAMVAGAVAAYCTANKKLSDSLAGVAISVALVPPLCVVGIGLSMGQPEISKGALLLYLTNLAGISVAGALVLLLLGQAPLHRARKGLLASSALIALLAIPLAMSMRNLIIVNTLQGDIKELLSKTYTFRNSRLRDIEFKNTFAPPLVIATVQTDQQLRPHQVKMVQDKLSHELNMDLNLKIRIVPVIEVSASDPEPAKKLEPTTQTEPVQDPSPGVQDPSPGINDQAPTGSEAAPAPR